MIVKDLEKGIMVFGNVAKLISNFKISRVMWLIDTNTWELFQSL